MKISMTNRFSMSLFILRFTTYCLVKQDDTLYQLKAQIKVCNTLILFYKQRVVSNTKDRKNSWTIAPLKKNVT